MEFIHFLQDTPAAVICLALVAWWALALVWFTCDRPPESPAAKLVRMAQTDEYREGFLRGYRAARFARGLPRGNEVTS